MGCITVSFWRIKDKLVCVSNSKLKHCTAGNRKHEKMQIRVNLQLEQFVKVGVKPIFIANHHTPLVIMEVIRQEITRHISMTA